MKVPSSFYDEDYFLHGVKSGYGGDFIPYNEEHILPRVRELAQHLKQDCNPQSVLDVGCARGYLVRALREVGINAVGIDISKWAIQHADKDAKPYVSEGNAEDLSRFEENQFHMVTCLDTLEHVHNVQTAMDEICRVSDRFLYIRVPVNDPEMDGSHITIKNVQWWLTEFHKRGFRVVYTVVQYAQDEHVNYDIILERILRVAVLIPCWNSGNSLPIVLKALSRIDHHITVFCENNSKDNTVDIIKKWNHRKKFIRMRLPKDAKTYFKTPYDNIAIVRQILLNWARRYTPKLDYIWFVDSDTVPYDSSILKRLTDRRGDIVGGNYYRHFPEGQFIATLFHTKDPKPRAHLKHYIPPKVVTLVKATSAGCLLISRKVFMDKRLNFWPVQYEVEPGEFMTEVSEDFGYCLNGEKLGYLTWLDASSSMFHIEEGNPKMWATKVVEGRISFQY
jgi:ubiquinone/menaquinone biosynthesis C-methylase UbiE